MIGAGSASRHNRRLALFVLAIVLIFCLLWVLRSVLFPFVFGLLLTYLLLPIIQWAERRLQYKDSANTRSRRVLLIVLVFIALLTFGGLFLFYITASVLQALSVLMQNAPRYMSEGLLRFHEWLADFRAHIPEPMQKEVDQLVLDAGQVFGNAMQGIFDSSISFVPQTIGLIMGFASLPIFLFYLLRDWEKLSRSLYAGLPLWVVPHVRGIFSIIDVVMGRYLRATLTLGLVVGIMDFIGLEIIGVGFAVALGVFAGLTEMIPILGPWIGGFVAVIVTLANTPEKAIWVALLFLVVQMLENLLLVPRIHGAYLRVHPALVMVLLVAGSYFAGIWGLLLAVPLTATLVEAYKYVRDARVKDTSS